MRCSGGICLLVHVAAVLGVSLPADLPCREKGALPSHAVLPRGVVSVEDFGADATGDADSTAAFKDALTFARTDNVTLFVPLGCYVITDTLRAVEPRDGRWQPTQIVGERSAPGGRRPAFVLPPNTAGFTSRSEYKPMMSFWTNWCLAHGPEAEVFYDDEWCGDSHSMSPWLFNMVVQDLDFVIGEGNFGAVGLYMVGAQGSTIQDITVFAGRDGLAGVAGGNGGGGVFAGITVVGGRFGLDARVTDGSATYTSMTLVNQSCAGMLVGPGAGSTTAAIGMHIEGSPSLGGVVAAMGLPSAVDSDCYAPAARLGAEATKSHQAALRDPVSLVDVSFKLFGQAPCVKTNASLWVQNLYSEGCAEVVVSGGIAVAKAVAGTNMHIEELALGRQDFEGMSDQPFRYGFPTIRDGERSEDLVLQTDNAASPVDLVSRHHWGPTAADWQSAGAINALNVGAKGDGLTDDWAMLQAALDAHDIIVLPKGLYRLSQTLVMRRKGSSLIGVGDARSIIMPLSQGFASTEQPVLDMAAEDGTVKGLTVVTWSHFASTYAMRWSGTGTWRQAFTTREPESVFPLFQSVADPESLVPAVTDSVSINRALVVISGGGAFYDFDVDFGCCFGNVMKGGIGPDTASTDEVLLQRPGFRTLLVNGSTAGLRFYPHNTEQGFSDAYTEIAHSFNVTLYNTKSENNYAVLWIRDSDLISVHGFGGNACPFPNASRYGGETDLRGDVARWADLGAGCCVTDVAPLFSGKVEGGASGCQAKCAASGEACGHVSSGWQGGTSSWCTIWPSTAACALDAGGAGHCGSRGDDGVRTYSFTGGYAPFMPSSFRVQRSSRVTLANIVNTERIINETNFLSAGLGYDPQLYNMILYQDVEGVCDPVTSPETCSASPVLDRPVLWRWTGSTRREVSV